MQNPGKLFLRFLLYFDQLFFVHRQTPNELTGEHSCIMIKILDSPIMSQMNSSWLQEYFRDFSRRFISLLGFQFRNFQPSLALSILQNKNYLSTSASGNYKLYIAHSGCTEIFVFFNN